MYVWSDSLYRVSFVIAGPLASYNYCDLEFILATGMLVSVSDVQKVTLLYKLGYIDTNLCVSTLVVNLREKPINKMITWKKDGVLFTFLLQLDSDGDQLLVGVDVQQTHRSCTIMPLSSGEPLHDFQIANVDMSILQSAVANH